MKLLNTLPKKLAVAGLAAALGIGGYAIAANAAVKPDCKNLMYPLCARSVAAGQVVDNSLPGYKKLAPGSVSEDRLSKPVVTKLNAVGTGKPGLSAYEIAVKNGFKGTEKEWLASLQGGAGSNGSNGKDAILSVTAASALVDRPDSGLHGDWAKDQMTRTVAITRQSAATASKCGSGATKCWFYTGSIVDNGSFATITGAKSPEAGADISGTVAGTVAGASQIEFYASSDAPDPSKVDVTVTGAAHPTGEWVKMFFPKDTVVTDTDLLDWSWSYSAPGTCETWTNAKAGNKGDVTGVNACK